MNEAEQFLKSKNPFEKFSEWFQEAKNTQLKTPDAFTLSTTENNQPHSRVLLLKEIRADGLVFYSNYESAKGQQLAANKNVSMNFFWDPLWRQVIWHGSVEKITYDESKKYWAERPRMSQISQLVSKQSQPAPPRDQLEKMHLEMQKKYENQEIPCPKNWGGYLMKPTYVEFWIGQQNRFHDRFAYTKVKNEWSGKRLYP